jgi:hypothetical protein
VRFRHQACSVGAFVNVFQLMAGYLVVLVLAIGIIFLLTRTRHH